MEMEADVVVADEAPSVVTHAGTDGSTSPEYAVI
jgi:hypothetical protein